jgi:hypothetical protein
MNYAQNCVLKTTDVDDPIHIMQQKRSEKRLQASFKNAAEKQTPKSAPSALFHHSTYKCA